MKAFWWYTLARIGVFLATWAAVWAVSQWWFDGGQVFNLGVLLVALVISSVISLFALGGLRDRLALRIQERAAAINDRIEQSRRAEDVD